MPFPIAVSINLLYLAYRSAFSSMVSGLKQTQRVGGGDAMEDIITIDIHKNKQAMIDSNNYYIRRPLLARFVLLVNSN